MDAFARGLKIAAAIRADGRLEQFVKQRYASWDSGLGASIEGGKESFRSLEKIMLEKGEAHMLAKSATLSDCIGEHRDAQRVVV